MKNCCTDPEIGRAYGASLPAIRDFKNLTEREKRILEHFRECDVCQKKMAHRRAEAIALLLTDPTTMAVAPPPKGFLENLHPAILKELEKILKPRWKSGRRTPR